MADIDIEPKNEGKRDNGFTDHNAEYPYRSYINVASTNEAARGYKINRVYTGGGYKNVSLDLKPLAPSGYPNNQVKQTASGHITEYDDTPGSERILIRHRTGSGVEMRSDGTMIFSSVSNTVRVTCHDEKVIVDGDGELVYNGNLSLQVAGNFDLVVGGDFNVTTGGNNNEEIRGSHKKIVRKTQKTVITEHQSNFVGGEQTETILGSANKIIKGDTKQIVEGGFELYSGDEFMITAENVASISSPNINIGAKSLTLIGDSGTIGGDNIIHYAHNYYGTSATFTHGVTAPTFHGDLDGTAAQSVITSSQNYGEAATSGSAFPLTNTATNTDATVEPTLAIMSDYLHASSFGVKEVSIDPGGVLKDTIDKTNEYGGVANRELTVSEVRSKLRDRNTLGNAKFIGAMIAEGKLNPGYIQAAPSKIGRAVSVEASAQRGSISIGNSGDLTKRYSK